MHKSQTVTGLTWLLSVIGIVFIDKVRLGMHGEQIASADAWDK